MIVDTAIQTCHTVLERLLPFFQNRKNRYSCIGAAIACILLRHVYATIALPPRHLRSFPRVSTFAILNSFKNLESVPNRIKRLINPITDAGYSFYMVCIWHDSHLNLIDSISFYLCVGTVSHCLESVCSRSKRCQGCVDEDRYAPIGVHVICTPDNPEILKMLAVTLDNFPKTHNFFGKSGDNTPVAVLLGKENVAVSNGDVWRKQRRVSTQLNCYYMTRN